MSYSIGELGRLTETKVETIRYYERTGLMAAPDRTAGNYRLYDEAALNRLSFIRRARNLGFSIEQVQNLLALSDNRDQSCAEVDAITTAHLNEIERKIADLQALQGELSSLLGQCRRGKVSECLIIDTLAPNRSA